MSSWVASVVVAVISLIGTLCGSYFSNRKSSALMEYRLQQLEDKVNKHNNLIERTYKLEEDDALHAAELKRINERLKIVESEE